MKLCYLTQTNPNETKRNTKPQKNRSLCDKTEDPQAETQKFLARFSNTFGRGSNVPIKRGVSLPSASPRYLEIVEQASLNGGTEGITRVSEQRQLCRSERFTRFSSSSSSREPLPYPSSTFCGPYYSTLTPTNPASSPLYILPLPFFCTQRECWLGRIINLQSLVSP